ncbi:hypothetical protein QM012_003744 [Aureobasidium pullulans]|uniref:Uncharacterized protein n=1 Tax=Aureobasidium pullulans TaxID=5580 RepID=A0ABR0T7S1_AURPU
MADDIPQVHATQSTEDAASSPNGDHPVLSDGLVSELTRFFNLCTAVDEVAYSRDVLNALADVDFAAIQSHEQTTNVDMHTINLDILTSLADHNEWLRLTNTALRNLPEIYRLTYNVIVREE